MKRMRRTMLFVPANNPGMLKNAAIFGADSVILDLEDAVSPSEKDAARTLVRCALQSMVFPNTEIAVRINPLFGSDYGQKDIEQMAYVKPDVIMLPKASKKEVQALSELLDKIEMARGLSCWSTKIIPLIETAEAVVNMKEIAGASRRIAGLLLGAEDLTADLGIKRTAGGMEIMYVRSKMAFVCRAAGIDAIDTPFTSTVNLEGLIEDTKTAKNLGLTGKAAIHPGQIDVIHQVFLPDQEDIEYARRVINAMEQAEKAGKGVFSLDDKMVDAPIVARARQTLEKAKQPKLW